ncbi:putative pentatricopeptide repeat-containing protein At1g12700, mitochondrial [Eucalyptus grandis]|uniref:putative pentatricopeptide repeat-containing protein At1g12700, mitochondrial n=1 Tax=Eucalyptus grandis TaxID=71139 RepID=UPI00192EBBE5|nr:putative pentatricopeptide repeat-containing protein At1g12700, mitochondrial [Eucalyptus grandis]
MKPTKFCPASSIFLLLHAPAAISSESSSHSILHLLHPSHLPFSSRRRRRFSSTPNPNLDDPNQVLSYVRRNCRAGGGGFTSLGDALCCFGKMIKASPLPSSGDFRLLLGAIVRMKHYSTAIRLIEQLPSLGIEDDVALLTIWMNCFCRLRQVDMGLCILGRIFKLGFPITVVTSSTLIDGLFIQGKTDQALRFLDYMGRNGPEPNETTYAIVAKGLCRAGNTRLAIELLRDWEERSCRINSFTYNIVIDGLCKED